nr:helix-turn-helix transcriptional regulator [Streptococcus dysgalactiae]
MDKQTILALKLKDYRDKNGLTQAQLAEQLEVSDKTISKWENGETYPSKRNMLAISEKLGFSIETLLIESQEKNSRGLKIGNYLLDYFFLLMAIVFIIITITSHNIVFLSSVVICLIFGLKKIN